jgi:hypothetical protein
VTQSYPFFLVLQIHAHHPSWGRHPKHALIRSSSLASLYKKGEFSFPNIIRQVAKNKNVYRFLNCEVEKVIH